jgi:hypothetical protein
MKKDIILVISLLFNLILIAIGLFLMSLPTCYEIKNGENGYYAFICER